MKRTGVCRNIGKYIRIYSQWFFYVAINICQTCTIFERISSNARHGVGNGDGGQAAATLERLISNDRYGVGDGDGA